MDMPPFEEPEEAERQEGKIKRAMGWLKIELMAGPRPAKELTDLARTAGHASSTLAVARRRLHLHTIREDNRYMWYTPTQWRQAKAAASKVEIS
jgi:hypothetical protein